MNCFCSRCSNVIVSSLFVFKDIVLRDALRNKLVNTNTGQIKAAKFTTLFAYCLDRLLTNEMFMQIYICSVIPEHLLPSLLPPLGLISQCTCLVILSQINTSLAWKYSIS